MTTEKLSYLINFKRLKTKCWFLKKADQDYGPFSKLEIVQMLQEKVVHPDQQIRKMDGAKTWTPICHVEDFKNENIRDLKKELPDDSQNVFFKRQHARKNFDCQLIVHNNKLTLEGESYEISAGGAGLVLNTNQLQTGQTLLIHFQPGSEVPPFNAVCKVVSKLPNNEIRDNASTKYGVTFTSISSSIRASIRQYAQEETQKAAI